MLKAADISIENVLRFFTRHGLETALLVPTETGLEKSIMDATGPVREFLCSSGLHDYRNQPQGEAHKKLLPTRVVTADGVYSTKTSLYRPPTKNGDPRIWIYRLGQWAQPNNVLALLATKDGELLVINASSPGLLPLDGAPANPEPKVDISRIIEPLVDDGPSQAAIELLSMIRAIAGRWHQGLPGVRRDLEVGRLLEELLGLRANSSKAPDYKGIEIKASRASRSTKQTLFAQVPDWTISPFKSSAQILDAFGYVRGTKHSRRLYCTVSAKKPNTQGLYLEVDQVPHRLSERSTNPIYRDVAYWPMDTLKEALAHKHPETFWVTASARAQGPCEMFKYEKVHHTKRPITSALPTLLEAGIVTVDHLIGRSTNGQVRERGPLFRIERKNFDLLFPPGVWHKLD